MGRIALGAVVAALPHEDSNGDSLTAALDTTAVLDATATLDAVSREKSNRGRWENLLDVV